MDDVLVELRGRADCEAALRWTVAGANAMLALRCWILDRRLHDFQPAAARSPPLATAA